MFGGMSATANPYTGATLSRAAPPVSGPTGTLGGFSSSGAPPNVAPGATRRGRTTRGSNVTIPYARIVPCVDAEAPDTLAGAMTPPNALKEADQYAGLHAGEIAFVYDQAKSSNLSLFRNASDTQDRMQKLCSFYYLSRLALFSNKMTARADVDFSFTRTPSIGQYVAPVVAAPGVAAVAEANKLVQAIRGLADPEVVHDNADNIGTAMHFFRAITAPVDFSKFDPGGAALGAPLTPVNKTAMIRESDEVFTAAGAKAKRLGLGAFGAMFNLAYKGAESVSMSSGLVAGVCSDYSVEWRDTTFEHLQGRGALDWRPDGVVMSKLDDTESSERTADSYARMGMMYNIAVQGPAHCKTLKSLNKQMNNKTSPSDELYVLLTAEAKDVQVAFMTEMDAYNAMRGSNTLAALFSLPETKKALDEHTGFDANWAPFILQDTVDAQESLGSIDQTTSPFVLYNRADVDLATADHVDNINFLICMFMTYTPAAIKKVFAATKDEAISTDAKFAPVVNAMYRRHANSGFFDMYEELWQKVKSELVLQGAPLGNLEQHAAVVPYGIADTDHDIGDAWPDGTAFDDPAYQVTRAVVTPVAGVLATTQGGGITQALFDLGIVGGWVVVVSAAYSNVEYDLSGSQQMWKNEVTRIQSMRNTTINGVVTQEIAMDYTPLKKTQRFVMGAWKIGTVLDSASMPIVDTPDTKYMLNSAMNPARAFSDQCNVAVEWKSARMLSAIFGGLPPKSRVRP